MVTKIVVDTNIFVIVLIGREGSAAREILRRCLQGNYQPLMGNALFAEYQDVMNRDEMRARMRPVPSEGRSDASHRAKCPLTESEAKDLLADFMSVCQWVKIFYLWRPNLKDEADNHLIELAIAGNAQIIVTRNISDFKRSQLQFPQIKILKPEEIL